MDKRDFLNGMILLPPAPGTCPECGVQHDPGLPHNQQSLYYQYHFFQENGRWPTWSDAMAHCSDEMKSFWKKELSKRGVTPE